MSYGLAIHTKSLSFPLRNGRRSFEKIKSKEGFIHFRVPLERDEYVVEYRQGSLKLGDDFNDLVKEAVESEMSFSFCYFLLPHNDTDEDIISLFAAKPNRLLDDGEIAVDRVYRIE